MNTSSMRSSSKRPQDNSCKTLQQTKLFQFFIAPTNNQKDSIHSNIAAEPLDTTMNSQDEPVPKVARVGDAAEEACSSSASNPTRPSMLEFLLPLNVKPNNDHYIVSEPGQATSVNIASAKHILSQLGQDLCISKECNSSNSGKYVYITMQPNQPNIT